METQKDLTEIENNLKVNAMGMQMSPFAYNLQVEFKTQRDFLDMVRFNIGDSGGNGKMLFAILLEFKKFNQKIDKFNKILERILYKI
jgi:hypothetical protein